ncbi:sugar phosphate isomerase/epimerase family protein [Deinococcus rubellus]|uniref:Sugar phosphate isomerase/epimerase n=1 Tax=Deinococcus rubellus TaxID=1889240 RepID=A0ABY5YI94_9DEIO|nr:sugar phosphate isomerase/epimerase family protein [Deinococcus rubellus]UWX64817.1 sugar phosphate isomerase/epimerase [Deinococcus rubellus]
MNDLSRLGLAVTLPELRQAAGWLKDGARDVELQDICEVPALLDGDWREVARQSRELLEGHTGRIGVHAPFWNLSLASLDPEIRRVVQSRYLLGLDYAEAVGGTHLVIHSPFYFFGHALVAHRDTLEQEIELTHLTLRPVLERAEQLGCTLVIENILDTNPEPLLALVTSFDSPFVRLSIDVGHAHLMAARGGPQASHWLHAADQWLGHVHLQDNDAASDAHLAPGEGTVHWPSILRALRAGITDPRLIVEVRPSELERAMAWVDGVSTGLDVHSDELRVHTT